MNKRILTLLLSIVLLVITAGCATTGSSSNVSSAETSSEEPLRIACLAPSFLAILQDLGLSDSIVVVDLNTKTLMGFGENLPAIDMMSPDVEKLSTLDLDILFASDMVKYGKSEDPFKVLSDSGVDVEYFASSESIAAIQSDILRVASLVNKDATGQTIVDKMNADIDAIKATVQNTKKKVYFEIDTYGGSYSFGSGTYLDEMITLAGGQNIFTEKNSYMNVSLEQVTGLNPDVIFTNVSYTGIDEVASIKAREGWGNISAIKNGNVFFIDSNYTSQPNQNIVKALQAMADAIKSAK